MYGLHQLPDWVKSTQSQANDSASKIEKGEMLGIKAMFMEDLTKSCERLIAIIMKVAEAQILWLGCNGQIGVQWCISIFECHSERVCQYEIG